MSKLHKMYDEQDATSVALPQYREPEFRPYRAGDYTRPSQTAELRQPDRPPSLGFQLMTAGENYGRGHDFFKTQFDRTGITDAAAESRDYYENELAYSNPVLAAVGSTLAGEAFDFWREAATDPINIATAGMGAAPRAALGSGVRSGTLHRAAKLAKAVDDVGMAISFEGAASEAKIAEEYVKALRGMRSRQRELARANGQELADFEASEPLHLDAITSALEDGLGRKYDTRAILAFPKQGNSYSTPVEGLNNAFAEAFGYERRRPGADRSYNLAYPILQGDRPYGEVYNAALDATGGGMHTLIDADGAIYGGRPAKPGAGMRNLGLGAVERNPETGKPFGPSPFNLDAGGRGITRPDEAPDLFERISRFPDDPEALKAWAIMQDRLSAGDRAYDAERVGGIAGARKWDSGVPWEIHGEMKDLPSWMVHSAEYAAQTKAESAQEAYSGPSLIKMYKK